MTKEELAVRIQVMERELQVLKNALQLQETPVETSGGFNGRVIESDLKLFDIPRHKLGALL